jgi:hypothetical protein
MPVTWAWPGAPGWKIEGGTVVAEGEFAVGWASVSGCWTRQTRLNQKSRSHDDGLRLRASSRRGRGWAAGTGGAFVGSAEDEAIGVVLAPGSAGAVSTPGSSATAGIAAHAHEIATARHTRRQSVSARLVLIPVL